MTLSETGLGFLIAMAVGVSLGARWARWLLERARADVVVLQVVPKVAIVPLFVVWFGFGMGVEDRDRRILALFPIMLNVMLGVRSVDPGTAT